jgi:ribulose-phosphate 3-epimerase
MTEATRFEIVPSVLPADFARLGDEVSALEEAGVDRIQWDVMDGRFVPNLTFGPDVIAASRKHCSVPFEAHLMVVEPDELMHRYVEAGCDLVIVHAEACVHLHRTLSAIREAGAKSGVALNPATPASAVAHVLDLADMVLVMTVNPGFGGQNYIATMEPKIREVREMIDTSGFDIDLEVDGGINDKTVAGAAAAGARILVAGSGLYKHADGLGAAVADLRKRAEEAVAGSGSSASGSGSGSGGGTSTDAAA